MTPQEALKVMVTGTPLFVAGKSFESECIEVLTDQQFSHAATFYWQYPDSGVGAMIPMVAEENERDGSVFNAGFQTVPFTEWLTQQTGPIYFGTPPQAVKDHPEKVLAIIQWYQDHPADQHYGFGSLLPILVNHWLDKCSWNVDIPIPTWAEVCSTMDAAIQNACGANVPVDETPGDMAARSLPLTLIQTA